VKGHRAGRAMGATLTVDSESNPQYTVDHLAGLADSPRRERQNMKNR